MRLAWDRIAVVAVSGAAWLMILAGGPHLAHALRAPVRLAAHAGAASRRRAWG